jgi:hypothetical protein
MQHHFARERNRRPLAKWWTVPPRSRTATQAGALRGGIRRDARMRSCRMEFATLLRCNRG